MSWHIKKQLLLFSGFALAVLLAVSLFIYRVQPQASCFDRRQNQHETGIDCGGECSACLPEAPKELLVLWTRFFEVRPGEYEVASLIENPNAALGIQSLPYTYRLTDQDGNTLAIRQGTAFSNPSARFLIFEAGIITGSRVPKKATLTLKSFNWDARSADTIPVTVVKTERKLTQERPQLTVTLGNDSIQTISKVNLQVVLLDKAGNAVAVDSSSDITVPDTQTKEVVFTWPRAFPVEVTSVNVYLRRSLW